jgi:chemotaxis protein CheC
MLDQLSILKEVGNIAGGHSAAALSTLLGRKIVLTVPATDIIACQKVPSDLKFHKNGIGVFSKILVGLRGEVAFVLDEENVFKLIDLSYNLKDKQKRPGVMTEMGLSLVKEIGNVVIASYLNALSLVLKRVIIPPIPTLVSGSIAEVLNIILNPYAGEEHSYLIETFFSDTGGNIKGSFYLVLTPDTAKDVSAIWRSQLSDGADGQEAI